MMEIVCDSCQKKYRIDENKLKKEKTRIRCTACQNFITVIKPGKLIKADRPSPPLARPDAKIVRTAAMDTTVAGQSQSAPSLDKVSWLNSIQFRVSMVLFLLTAIILTAFVAFNFYRNRSRLDSEFHLIADITASRLSIHLMESLWDLDDKQVGDSLEAEMLDRQIHSIIVRDNDDKTIFSGRTRDPAWKIVETDKNLAGSFVKSSKPIRKGEEHIGLVEVYLTPRFMEEDFKQLMINIIITAVTLIFSIFIVLYISMRQMIIRPIMRLTDVAEKMSMGVLDAGINIHSKNEIGLLAAAIERMQISLRMAIERLRSR